MHSLEILAETTFTQEPPAERGLPGKEYILSYQKWTEKDRSNVVIGVTRNFSLVVKDEKGHYSHYGIYQGMPPQDTQTDKEYLEETLKQMLEGKMRLALIDKDPKKYPGQKKPCEYEMVKNDC